MYSCSWERAEMKCGTCNCTGKTISDLQNRNPGFYVPITACLFLSVSLVRHHSIVAGLPGNYRDGGR